MPQNYTSFATLFAVITDNGDGSNSIWWVTDPQVLDKMQELADDGDDQFASGDGLQVRSYRFPEGFDLDEWLKVNMIHLTTLEDFN